MQSIRQFFHEARADLKSAEEKRQEMSRNMEKGVNVLLKWVDQINSDLHKAQKNIEIHTQLGGKPNLIHAYASIPIDLTASLPPEETFLSATEGSASSQATTTAKPKLILLSHGYGGISKDITLHESYYSGFQHLTKWLAKVMPHDCIDTVCDTLDRIEYQDFHRKRFFGTPTLRQG